MKLEILTTDKAREMYPNLFTHDPENGDYFLEIPAHGNGEWFDFWPDLVAIVSVNGRVFMSSNASAWWVADHGLEVT